MSDEEVGDLTQYVLNLSGQEADSSAVQRASEAFADNCAACHGEDGKGIQEMGGPNLTDADWLYDGSPEGSTLRSTMLATRSCRLGKTAWTSRPLKPSLCTSTDSAAANKKPFSSIESQSNETGR